MRAIARGGKAPSAGTISGPPGDRVCDPDVWLLTLVISITSVLTKVNHPFSRHGPADKGKRACGLTKGSGGPTGRWDHQNPLSRGEDFDVAVGSVHADPLSVLDEAGGAFHADDGREAVFAGDHRAVGHETPDLRDQAGDRYEQG